MTATPDTPPPPNSLPGKISFFIAIGLFATGILLWTIAFATLGPEHRGFNRSYNTVLAIFLVGVSPLGHLAGFVLGIIGLTRPNRRKVLAILGTILNGLFVIGALGLLLLGLSGLGAH